MVRRPSFICYLLKREFVICRCMIAFPDDYKSLVPKLLIEIMAVVGSSFISRINLATADIVPGTLGKG